MGCRIVLNSNSTIEERMEIRNFLLFKLVGIVLFSIAAVTSAFAQYGPSIDPLNPPATVSHPYHSGSWALDTSLGGGDLRNAQYLADSSEGGPVWAEWIKSNGFLYTDYYLKGRLGGTYNMFNAGQFTWTSETNRDTGVLGPFCVSISTAGPPSQYFAYLNPGVAPVAGDIGLLVTNQLWMVVLRIRIPQFYWDYYSNQYVFSGYYYDWDKNFYVNTPVSRWYYRYVP